MHTYIKTKSLCTDSDLEVDRNILTLVENLVLAVGQQAVRIQDPNRCRGIEHGQNQFIARCINMYKIIHQTKYTI